MTAEYANGILTIRVAVKGEPEEGVKRIPVTPARSDRALTARRLLFRAPAITFAQRGAGPPRRYRPDRLGYERRLRREHHPVREIKSFIPNGISFLSSHRYKPRLAVTDCEAGAV